MVEGSVQPAQEGGEGIQVADPVFAYRDGAVREADESAECVFRACGGKGCEEGEEEKGVMNIMILLFDQYMQPSLCNKFRKPH